MADLTELTVNGVKLARMPIGRLGLSRQDKSKLCHWRRGIERQCAAELQGLTYVGATYLNGVCACQAGAFRCQREIQLVREGKITATEDRLRWLAEMELKYLDRRDAKLRLLGLSVAPKAADALEIAFRDAALAASTPQAEVDDSDDEDDDDAPSDATDAANGNPNGDEADGGTG